MIKSVLPHPQALLFCSSQPSHRVPLEFYPTCFQVQVQVVLLPDGLGFPSQSDIRKTRMNFSLHWKQNWTHCTKLTMTQNYKYTLHKFSKSFGAYTIVTRQTNNSIIRAVQKVSLIRQDN